MSFNNSRARLTRLRPTTSFQRGPCPTSTLFLFPAHGYKQIHSRSRIGPTSSSPAPSARQNAIQKTSTPTRGKATSAFPKTDTTPPKSLDGLAEKSMITPESLLNPPDSTRPPPLELPVRDPSKSRFKYLFTLGKAYSTFYKTGLKAVFTNRKLLRDGAIPTHQSSAHLQSNTYPSRAFTLTSERTRHDYRRLPIFGLIVLICGEFTPLAVLAFPKITPYTCRIPKQQDIIRRSAESRRRSSRDALHSIDKHDNAAVADVAPGHICRSLGLGSALWDKVGVDVPSARKRAAKAITALQVDDHLIRDGGGVKHLVDGEVVLACEKRGINTFSVDAETLRQKLADWLDKTNIADHKADDDSPALAAKMFKTYRDLILGF
ncbi:hypothetical protein F5Y18DRAFT_433000 [Xylariaceae sp. FL1019]|nr:hypothetical protein F5Y18DRAFT_433000 [Xylariaceae sp. FL1019]